MNLFKSPNQGERRQLTVMFVTSSSRRHSLVALQAGGLAMVRSGGSSSSRLSVPRLRGGYIRGPQ
jgi:hypothetical protein